MGVNSVKPKSFTARKVAFDNGKSVNVLKVLKKNILLYNLPAINSISALSRQTIKQACIKKPSLTSKLTKYAAFYST